MDLLERRARARVSEPTHVPSGSRVGLLVAAVLAVLTGLRLGFLAWGGLDLSPDEAHYWEWSRRLDLSYYSKGPVVAYLIAGLTAVFGASAFGIRLGAVGLSLLGAWTLYRLGRELFGRPEPGALAVVGLQLTPLVWAGSLLMTIDAPFVVAWTLGLWAAHRALSDGGAGAWLLLGLAVGVGSLAKYTMLFALPGFLLYLWLAPERRPSLRSRGPVLAVLTALVALAPVLVWNARTGWVSARHVASQGRGGGLTLEHLVEFLGSQLLVLTPLVAALLGWGLWVGVHEGFVRRREPYRFLLAFAAPVLGFYLVLALQGKVQANWPAAAYPSLALATAGLLLERRTGPAAMRGRAQPRLLIAAAAVALGASALGHVIDRLDLPRQLDPATRLRGWAELGRAVGMAVEGMPDPRQTFLGSNRYQVASELAFYTPGRPPAYNFNLGRRLNQYDFWEGPDSRLGWDAVYVEEGAHPLDGRVRAAFARVDPPIVVEIRRGERVIRVFSLHRSYGFRGAPLPTGRTRY
jgi:4-amino-4-deoxy-L-arabinose transferase-like glycosyltransferase